MTAYDPHLRRLMRSLVAAAKSQDASSAAWLRQEFGRGLEAVESGAEPALGNPANDGEVLSSTVAGVRSWRSPVSDEAASVELAAAATHTSTLVLAAGTGYTLHARLVDGANTLESVGMWLIHRHGTATDVTALVAMDATGVTCDAGTAYAVELENTGASARTYQYALRRIL